MAKPDQIAFGQRQPQPDDPHFFQIAGFGPAGLHELQPVAERRREMGKRLGRGRYILAPVQRADIQHERRANAQPPQDRRLNRPPRQPDEIGRDAGIYAHDFSMRPKRHGIGLRETGNRQHMIEIAMRRQAPPVTGGNAPVAQITFGIAMRYGVVKHHGTGNIVARRPSAAARPDRLGLRRGWRTARCRVTDRRCGGPARALPGGAARQNLTDIPEGPRRSARHEYCVARSRGTPACARRLRYRPSRR